MNNLINIYNDSESAIIIDESTTTLTQVEGFPSLGESPFNIDSGETLDDKSLKNLFFIELNVFDEEDSLIVTLNSAKPLLKLPSTGKYYFGDFHVHNNGYMVGAKHTSEIHEGLEVEKSNQFVPYPIEQKLYQDDFQQTIKKFVIKTSEIFDVLKNLPGVTLDKNDKFFITYGVFQDIFLLVRERSTDEMNVEF